MTNNTIFLAPELDEMKRRALAAVDQWATARMSRPAPGMDAFKLSEACKVLRGEPSRLIATEARLNGLSAEDQAHRVIAAADAAVNSELERVAAKASIRAAMTHAAILAVLKQRAIPFHTGPALGR